MSEDFEHERKSQEKQAKEHNLLTLRNIIIAGVGLFVMIIVVSVLVSGLWRTIVPNAAIQPAQTPPGPNLQVSQNADLQAYWATEEARLNTLAVEGERAVIPIDRAMALVAEQGVPSFAGVEGIDAPLDAGVAQGIPEGASEEATGGAQAFQSQGCTGCHQQEDSPTAPALVGVFGSEVPLEGGTTVTADEAYIRESILQPNAKVVQGYAPIMPSYDGRIEEEDLSAIVAYIQAIGQ